MKKKLIIFIPSIEDGGVEKNLYIITNYLSKKIKKINLLTYNDKYKNKFKKNVRIINPFFNFISFKNRYPKYFLCLLALFKILLFDRNYLILTFQANIFVIILCKILNIRIISRSNSSPSGWSTNFFKQIIFSYFLKKADAIIVNSEEFKKEMDSKYNIITYCILNPFEFSKIKKLSLKKCKKIYSKNSLKIISVGRLTYQKDFITLFKSIQSVNKIKTELILIGKGIDKYKLKNYIEENSLQKKIKLVGYQTNPFKFIRQADIFVLTSKFEGSPNVLIEAQYLKKYIISTDCPTGPKEILNNGKFGSLVKIGDYKSISIIIEKYKLNKNIKSKIKLGFDNTKNYNYEKNCLKYFQIINNYL
jgi:glycosyltransferase involved in cell wall biosynthesis